MSIKTARNYVADAADLMERVLCRMPIAADGATDPLPTTMQEITCYVEQLLTSKEEALCDMATD